MLLLLLLFFFFFFLRLSTPHIAASGKHVLIVEDLIDTGTTLEFVKAYIQTKKPKSVKLCCILDKKARRTSSVKVDYVGFPCPDEFVVGFGMDFAENYRTLPFVAVLKPSAYLKKHETDDFL